MERREPEMNYDRRDWEGMDVEMQVMFRDISKIESKGVGNWILEGAKQ